MKRTPRSRSSCTRGDDVVGAQGDVLHAGAVVVLDVLLDLALLQAVGRLVERHDDLRTVPHHGRHERRVLRADLVVVEVLHGGEAEDVGVEADPVGQLALGDVADDVVDPGQPDGPVLNRVGQALGGVAGFEETPGVAAAVDERVHRLAIGSHLGEAQVAVLVGLRPRRARPTGRRGRSPDECRVGVVDQPGQVVHPVAVAAHVLGDRRASRRGPRTRRSGSRPARGRSWPCRAHRSPDRSTPCSGSRTPP